MYGSSEVQKDLIPLSTLHMMTSSHSLFLPTMLESDEEPGRYQVKGTAHRRSMTDFKSCCSVTDYNHLYFIVITEALVTLLLCMVKKCPTVCNISHFVILLGAYGATLNVSGKKKNEIKGLSKFVIAVLSSHNLFYLADQKLLQLLQEYERNQVSLLKFQ